MKLLLGLAVLVVTLGVLHSATEDQTTEIPEDTLKRESAGCSVPVVSSNLASIISKVQSVSTPGKHLCLLIYTLTKCHYVI